MKILIFALSVSGSAFAASPAPAVKPAAIGTKPAVAIKGDDHPVILKEDMACSAELTACAKVGYWIGGASKNRGSWAHCVFPIAAGQKLRDVSFKVSDGCRKLIAEKQKPKK